MGWFGRTVRVGLGLGAGAGSGLTGVMTSAAAVSRLECGSGTGSGWSPLTVAMFRSTVPAGAVAFTVVTIVRVSEEPAAGVAGTLAAVHVIDPLAPTTGVVHDSGALPVALTKPTPAGS